MFFCKDEAGFSQQLVDEVEVHCFSPCSSSSLELLTLIWAFELLGEKARGVTVFTDSQTIVGLPGRRDSLEALGFCSRSDKPLSQGSLYRSFYDIIDRFAPRIEKVKGHRPKSEKTQRDLFFSLVDRASRSALRNGLQ